MPYYRKRRYKRYRRKPKRSNGWASAGKTVASIAGTALKVARGVAALVNVEYKTHDVSATGTAVPSTALIVSLTNFPQGDTNESRDANSARITSHRFRYMLSKHADNSDVFERVRVVLFTDKSNNNPGTADPVRHSSAYALFNNTDLLAQTYKVNWDRYKIIYDKIHILKDTYVEATYEMDYFKKYQDKGTGAAGMKVVYDAATTEPASKNNIWLMCWSETTTNPPNIKYASRVRFTDN